MDSLFWFVTLPSLLCCFIFYHRLLQSKKTSKVEPTEWPIVGHVCGMIANYSNYLDWSSVVLAGTGYNFKAHAGLIGAQYFITCDPSNVRHMLTSNFANYPKGHELIEITDILGGGIFNADGESWHRQRAKSQLVMMDPRFRAFSARYSLHKVEKSLLPFLAHTVGGRCDLQDVFMRLTFDVTCNLVFGVDPGCLQISLPAVPFAQAMDDAMDTVFLRHVIPPALWKLMSRWEIGTEKKSAAARRTIDHFAAEVVAARKAADHKTTCESADMLSSFISHDDDTSGSDKFLRDMTVNLLLAGRDTVGTALSWFFYLVCSNPRVEHKILDELATVVSSRRDDQVTDDMVVFDANELSGLVYLHAAMCECLRLYPPVPASHKVAVARDVLPSGHEVKAGENILIYFYSMGRMEGVWGKDCLEFKPERWINREGRLRYEPPYKFVAFNVGPRTCLGKEMAFVHMKVTTAAMLWNFAMELVPGHVVKPKLSAMLHMKNGLAVTVKRRKTWRS
ncbi:unnamed protein product [Alopecurus aequalis]